MASKKPEVAIILSKMKKREREQEPDFDDEDGFDDDGLEACAEDLISALRERNPTRVADALRDAFVILQSSPEPDFDDEDFDDED